MSAPAPVRCPSCFYLPPGAQVICTNCGEDKREPNAAQPGVSPSIPEEPAVAATECLYFRHQACACGGRGVCVEVA